jgi:hypothetical protein
LDELSARQLGELRAAALVHVFQEAARRRNPRLRDPSWGPGSPKWATRKVLVPLACLALPPALSCEGGVRASLGQLWSTLKLHEPPSAGAAGRTERRERDERQGEVLVELRHSCMQVVGRHELLARIVADIAARVTSGLGPSPFKGLEGGLEGRELVYANVSRGVSRGGKPAGLRCSRKDEPLHATAHAAVRADLRSTGDPSCRRRRGAPQLRLASALPPSASAFSQVSGPTSSVKC